MEPPRRGRRRRTTGSAARPSGALLCRPDRRWVGFELLVLLELERRRRPPVPRGPRRARAPAPATTTGSTRGPRFRSDRRWSASSRWSSSNSNASTQVHPTVGLQYNLYPGLNFSPYVFARAGFIFWAFRGQTFLNDEGFAFAGVEFGDSSGLARRLLGAHRVVGKSTCVPTLEALSAENE